MPLLGNSKTHHTDLTQDRRVGSGDDTTQLCSQMRLEAYDD